MVVPENAPSRTPAVLEAASARRSESTSTTRSASGIGQDGYVEAQHEIAMLEPVVFNSAGAPGRSRARSAPSSADSPVAGPRGSGPRRRAPRRTAPGARRTARPSRRSSPCAWPRCCSAACRRAGAAYRLLRPPTRRALRGTTSRLRISPESPPTSPQRRLENVEPALGTRPPASGMCPVVAPRRRCGGPLPAELVYPERHRVLQRLRFSPGVVQLKWRPSKVDASCLFIGSRQIWGTLRRARPSGRRPAGTDDSELVGARASRCPALSPNRAGRPGDVVDWPSPRLRRARPGARR